MDWVLEQYSWTHFWWSSKTSLWNAWLTVCLEIKILCKQYLKKMCIENIIIICSLDLLCVFITQGEFFICLSSLCHFISGLFLNQIHICLLFYPTNLTRFQFFFNKLWQIFLLIRQPVLYTLFVYGNGLLKFCKQNF